MAIDDSYLTDDNSISTVVRAQPDSIVPMNPSLYLHSALQNQFYQDFCDTAKVRTITSLTILFIYENYLM
jgi:hypothetical protein